MKIVLILLLISYSAFAQIAPDYAKEKRWAAQVEDALMDGDAVWLNANKHQFMSLYTHSETDTKRAAVIVHGIGIHPNWAQVIRPLRVALSEKGWHTLSIQMPVLANDATSEQYADLFDDADKRIASALKYIKEQGLTVDVLIAHSLGSVMSTHYLANNHHSFKRFVGIGMPAANAQYLSKVNIPTLDLYGSEDIETVLKSVNQRARASKANKNYTQKKVAADHFFNDKDDLLINQVSTWLK